MKVDNGMLAYAHKARMRVEMLFQIADYIILSDFIRIQNTD